MRYRTANASELVLVLRHCVSLLVGEDQGGVLWNALVSQELTAQSAISQSICKPIRAPMKTAKLSTRTVSLTKSCNTMVSVPALLPSSGKHSVPAPRRIALSTYHNPHPIWFESPLLTESALIVDRHRRSLLITFSRAYAACFTPVPPERSPRCHRCI